MASDATEPPIQLREGQFAVVREDSAWCPRNSVRQIQRVTPKMVTLAGGRPKRVSKKDVFAAFNDQTSAASLKSRLDGIEGKYQRRRGEADAERARRVTVAAEARDKAMQKALAEASK